MIQVQHLHKNFQHNLQTVLHNINLEIQTGEIFGLIGKSGAGKSTLLRCLNLLEKPDSGKIIVDGQDITQFKNDAALKPIRRQIGMIFQQFHLLSSKTVYQNVALALEIHPTPAAEIQPIVMELLDEVGLLDKKDAYPAQLSGGQKQRVAIARALAIKPKILLCDEATSALDPETTQSIIQLLRRIQNTHQLTLIIVAHQMEVIKQLCDRIAVLEQGEIHEVSFLKQFFIKPQSEAGKQLAAHFIRENLPANTVIPQMAQAGQQQILLRIFFEGDTTIRPIISDLLRHVPVEMNILQANIEQVRQTPLGIMIIQIVGNPEHIQATFDFFRAHQVNVEVLENVE